MIKITQNIFDFTHETRMFLRLHFPVIEWQRFQKGNTILSLLERIQTIHNLLKFYSPLLHYCTKLFLFTQYITLLCFWNAGSLIILSFNANE